MSAMIGLAYCDGAGRVYFDEKHEALADAGTFRAAAPDEITPAPPGTLTMVLKGRRPLLRDGVAKRRHTLAVALPSGYTRLLLPAYRRDENVPALPLFGYTYACAVDDRLGVAAMRTDEGEDWEPRTFAPGELERAIDLRLAADPQNRALRQLARCALEYACFTAQNVFLERGEAALPVSPACNARCVGCISQLEAEAGVPSPQERITAEASVGELARVAIAHFERIEAGIVSFGQGCEGEPLLRSLTIARTIELIRLQRSNGTVNLNTNGSMPRALRRCIDAGLQAVRISLNSFRPTVYAAYYRPIAYSLEDVFESIRIAGQSGVRVSLNLLTHPGVTDDPREVAAMRAFLAATPVDMIQTRTLNIDPEWYFRAVGRPESPLGMRAALGAIAQIGVRVGNFTHTH